MEINSPHYMDSNWSSNEGSYNWDAGLIYSWNAGLSSALNHWGDAGHSLKPCILALMWYWDAGVELCWTWAFSPAFWHCRGAETQASSPASWLCRGAETWVLSLASSHCINSFDQPCVWSIDSAFDDLSLVIFRQSTTTTWEKWVTAW